jgi:hypothetical protein
MARSRQQPPDARKASRRGDDPPDQAEDDRDDEEGDDEEDAGEDGQGDGLFRLLKAVSTSRDHDPVQREIVAQVLTSASWWRPCPRPKGVRKRKDRACFENSQKLVLKSGTGRTWSYVEGFALSALGVVVHHGWCGDEQGRAIDATWKEPGLAYFGVAFSAQEVARWLREKKTWGSMLTPDEFEGLRLDRRTGIWKRIEPPAATSPS